MTQLTAEKPNYGNWVSTKLFYIPGVLGVFFGALSVLLPWLAILSVIFLLCFAYFAYARWCFSPKGKNIQARIQSLLLDHLEWNGIGKALDIGCGNGALTIMLAKKYLDAHVTGVDYWGGAWEYSKGVCERNAEIEGVGSKVAFQKASASSLPFEDETFDVVISNLTFHEVGDIRDKSFLIKEALRVLRKGGIFVFQDLFLWKRVYGEVGDLLGMIRNWRVKDVEFFNTSQSQFIPKALKLPFMVGTIGILRGRK
ncbi:MAG: class I SAM-dependent methyltransferase [Anaerolineae bacterium]